MISPSDIVDVEGLSKVLSCSTATIKKTWREYPHIFIGLGRTAKSARFIVNDVVSYLIERDYKNGISRSKNKKMGRGFKSYRMSKKKEKRVQDQESGKKLGKYQEGRLTEPETRTDPIDNFRSMFAIS
ncbi:hypothetical protein [Desulfobacula toluolica]|uniref:hypothetical protein n=1 Tax=Desulfobacula toluolica TaxID=28223 RepID=UPI00031FDB57|nr:hypothetical protein [Desulfobacula toluolica]